MVSRAVAQADLVVVAGGAAGPLPSPRDLKPDAIVCNLGPVDEHFKEIHRQRSDVMLFDEVVVRLPGEVALHCDPRLPRASVQAWMAEAILLALEGRYDRYFLGRRLHVDKVYEMKGLSARHDVRPCGFMAAGHYQSFSEVN